MASESDSCKGYQVSRPWMIVAALAGVASVCLPSLSASAHDFWVRPDEFRIEPGGDTPVRLFVGHEDDVRQFGRKPDRIIRFESVSSEGIQPLRTDTSTLPAGRFTPTTAGVHVLVYQSNHAYLELPAPEFHAYLEHEGLDDIVKARVRAGKSDEAGRESYARYCKALVQVGDDSTGWSRAVGLPFEITPLDDAPPGSGSRVRVQVVFRGEPLRSAQVHVFDLDDLFQVTSTRTNRRGRARLRLPGDGPWAAAVTHMIPAPEDVKGDWESYWTTMTFAPVQR